MYGNLFVYYKLEGKKYIDAETRKSVIYVMSSIAASSLLMFFVLGKTKDESGKAHTEGPIEALKSTWRIFTTSNMRTLCITFIYIGDYQTIAYLL